MSEFTELLHEKDMNQHIRVFVGLEAGRRLRYYSDAGLYIQEEEYENHYLYKLVGTEGKNISYSNSKVISKDGDDADFAVWYGKCIDCEYNTSSTFWLERINKWIEAQQQKRLKMMKMMEKKKERMSRRDMDRNRDKVSAKAVC